MRNFALADISEPLLDELALEGLLAALADLLAINATDAGTRTSRAQAAVHSLCRAIEACEQAGIDKREILAHLGPARDLHAESPFIARAQEWPRGYQGDFETVEYICDAVNQAPPDSMGHALESIALASPITGQHRNKVAFQAETILATCKRKKEGARILSIGCGGCRDLRSIAPQLRPMHAEFVLCDFDYNALDFAMHRLGPLAEWCTYLNATVPRIFPKLARYGPFDLAIAGGVFDYLPDRWVTLSIRQIFHSLLAPGGELIFTNIKRGNPYRVWMEYLANWDLNEREETELRERCQEAGVPAGGVTVREDATGLALLASCRRNG